MPSRDSTASRERRALGAFGLLYLSWMVLRWGPPGERRVIGDLFQILIGCAAAAWSWQAARRCARVPELRSSWRVIAAGAVVAVLANVIQLYYEGVVGRLPHPSAAEVLMLCGYALVIAALLRFPVTRAGGVQRVQLALDASVFALAGAITMWYLELGPAVMHGSGQPVGQDVISILFTIGDLVVLAAVAGVLVRGTAPSSSRSLRLFAMGCLTFVAVDVLYGYISVRLHQTYHGGDWLDAVWFAGFVLWALAARAQRNPDPDELRRLHEAPLERRRPSWLPYVAACGCMGLTIYASRSAPFFPTLSLIIASVVLVALVAARQLAAQSELIDAQHGLQVAHDELAALATTDVLTGLPNHRGLMSVIDHELERTRRTERPFALAFLDLDHFKTLNDTLGHAAGDNALCEMAEIFRTSTRAADTVGRWGGEEFVVVMPETSAGTALEVAERVRAAIAHNRCESAGGAHLTCSIGVAVRPEDGTDRDSLLASADRALYVAKQLGRNQVVAAGDRAAAALAASGGEPGSEGAQLGAVEALAAVIDARDSYTAEHAAAVTVLAQRVALIMGCDANEAHVIGVAARLQDIGKIAVPDVILNKPGPLTAGERRLVEQHPEVGAEIAARIPALAPVTTLIRAHHERFDGTGYPDSLAGRDIPLGGRIICAADAYDAMITERPYGAGKTRAEAIAELHRCTGTQFDPLVVDALAQVLSGESPAAAAEPLDVDLPLATGRDQRVRRVSTTLA